MKIRLRFCSLSAGWMRVSLRAGFLLLVAFLWRAANGTADNSFRTMDWLLVFMVGVFVV
jgi:hypothetical protein